MYQGPDDDTLYSLGWFGGEDDPAAPTQGRSAGSWAKQETLYRKRLEELGVQDTKTIEDVLKGLYYVWLDTHG